MTPPPALWHGAGGTSGAAARNGQKLQQLRRAATLYILVYYWAAAACAVLAAAIIGGPVLTVALPLGAIGAGATLMALRSPCQLSTRLTMTVAINATWMFGLHVAADLQGGEYMLEVHTLYFINSAVILSYACWRSVLMTAVAALTHHLLLSGLLPTSVWPDAQFAWMHFANHLLLGSISCAAGIPIAIAIERFLGDLESLAAEAELRATHDDLTGLLNRRGLHDRIRGMLRGDSADLTVLLIDLDGFKQINDTVGHPGGDRLLVMAADKLRALAPANAAVSRVGGDEFVVVIPQAAPAQLDRLLGSFFGWARRPCVIDGRALRFGASIGVTSTAESGSNFETMLVDADIALYAAKTAGKNRYCRFDPALRESAVHARALADDVVRGLAADEFEPFFQTQHDADSGALVGLEALVRWRHPERGILSPPAFLATACNTGRIADIDRRMMTRAVEAIREMEAAGLQVPGLSVNVSRAWLTNRDFMAAIDALPPMRAKLSLETDESVLFHNTIDESTRAAEALRRRGIGLEIDDFGTGHASRLALTRLSPNGLKIDRALIAPLTASAARADRIRAIVDMGRSLDLRITAVGVETEEQARILRGMGVATLQGHLFSKPVSANELQTTIVERAA